MLAGKNLCKPLIMLDLWELWNELLLASVEFCGNL